MGTCHVVVVGLMATGKSTVGRAVAEHLGLPFLDNDELLEGRDGKTAAEVQAAFGQAELHRREAEVLRSALRRQEPQVITAAASVVEDDGARQALRDHLVVWLDGRAEVLAERVRDGDDHRPVEGRDLLGLLVEHQARRDPLFTEVADVVVDTTSSTLEEVIVEVADGLAARLDH